MALSAFISCSSSNQEDAIMSFVKELSTQNEEYVSWPQAAPQFAYALYDLDFTDTVATLYYIKADEQNQSGYIIVDTDNKVIEYAFGEPYYDTNPNAKDINRSGEKLALQRSKENLS